MREALQYTWGMEDVLVLNEMGKPFLMPERRMLLSFNQCLVRLCSASGCVVIGMKNTHCMTRYRGPCIWSVNWQTQLTAIGSSHSRGRYTICFINNYFSDFVQILLNFYFFLDTGLICHKLVLSSPSSQGYFEPPLHIRHWCARIIFSQLSPHHRVHFGNSLSFSRMQHPSLLVQFGNYCFITGFLERLKSNDAYELFIQWVSSELETNPCSSPRAL